MYVFEGPNLLDKYVYTIYKRKKKRMNQLKVLPFSSTITFKPYIVSRSPRVGKAMCITKSLRSPSFFSIFKLYLHLVILFGLNIQRFPIKFDITRSL